MSNPQLSIPFPYNTYHGDVLIIWALWFVGCKLAGH